MGVFDQLGSIPGLGVLEGFDAGGFFSGVGRIMTFIVLLAIASAIIGFFFYKRKSTQKYNQTIHFFESVNGQTIPIEDCQACELIIPGTSIAVFYIKSKDFYLPRGVIKMGKNSYWYAIRDNRELVNFSLKDINSEMKEAGLDYDHTDMRYANKNLKKIINDNYRSKSKKWWQEYKDVISTVIFIFVLSVAMYLLINKIGGLIGQVQPLLHEAQQVVAEVRELLVALDETRTICSGAGSVSGITPG